jgi:DNA repair protein RadC
MASAAGKKATGVGHRARLKKRVLDEGTKKLSDLELLEILLFYAVPRKDVSKYASVLIEKYGNISGVVNASPAEIEELTGLKSGTELLFSLLRETSLRMYAFEKESMFLEGETLKSFLIGLYGRLEEETVYALYFGDDGGYIGKQMIFHGNVNSARFSLRKVTEGVIRVGGKAVILAHNHPSGNLTPSQDDIISTKRIAAHLMANEIELIEHYIVSGDNAIGILNM